MVKIIAGEIVQDDDPRAQRLQNQQQRNNQPFPNAWNRTGGGGGGGRGGAGQIGGQRQPPQQQQQQASPFDAVNDKLRQFGLNDLNIQGHVIEPVFMVAAVLCLVFYGIPGLLVVAVVWYMSRQR